MLIRALLLVSLASQTSTPAASCPPPAQRLFLGALASAPSYYEGRLFEICGTVGEVGDEGPTERVLYDQSPRTGQYSAFFVSDPSSELPPPEGARVCLVGEARRRDGLTWREAEERGLPNRSLTDTALRDPDYVFYPIRCGEDAPARG